MKDKKIKNILQARIEIKKANRQKKKKSEVSLYDICQLYDILDEYKNDIKREYERECLDELKKISSNFEKVKMDDLSISVTLSNNCTVILTYELNDDGLTIKKALTKKVDKIKSEYGYDSDRLKGHRHTIREYTLDEIPFIDKDKLNKMYGVIDGVVRDGTLTYHDRINSMNKLDNNINTKSTNTQFYINNKDGKVSICNTEDGGYDTKQDFFCYITSDGNGKYTESYVSNGLTMYNSDKEFDDLYKKIYTTYDKIPEWMIEPIRDGYGNKARVKDEIDEYLYYGKKKGLK